MIPETAEVRQVPQCEPWQLHDNAAIVFPRENLKIARIVSQEKEVSKIRTGQKRAEARR